ncbi:S41 family peptidase [Candidatus Parcubacteria bacterium]|nr:S41 family peptidase [Candidatus Parcubacteria bacterium]
MEFAKKHKTAILSLFIAVVFFSLGERRGKNLTLTKATLENLVNTDSGSASDVDFSPFWKVWSTLDEKFVPTSSSTKPVTDQAKVYGAIQGLTASLGDPYTVFFPPTESKLFQSDIQGNFEGVGMEVVEENGVLNVIAPLKSSPAAKAGLLAGDKIIKIDDKVTSNLTTEDAIQLIRGDKGTAVTFTVIRQGKKEPLEIKVVRDTIDIPTIDSKSLGNDTYYIALYSFTANSPNLFRGALRQFIESGNHKLILDLRGNPGGYLEAALDMASWFLPAGKVVVRENFGPGKDETVYRSKGYDIFTDQLKFVILVDSGSASASEILAGALKEYGKAKLVGDKTFGKGSVQELVDVTPDTSLKVTVARWLTPNGVSISATGITPDVIATSSPTDIAKGKDTQLDKAKQVVNSM